MIPIQQICGMKNGNLFQIKQLFFKCSMYWEEKISQSMETNINDYLAKSWVFDVKRITLGLRWLI